MVHVFCLNSCNVRFLKDGCCKTMNMANKDGERGQPCLCPWAVKRCDISPLVVIVAIGDVYKILTQWINDSPKLNFFSVENRKTQFTLSNAFSASNETMAVGELV